MCLFISYYLETIKKLYLIRHNLVRVKVTVPKFFCQIKNYVSVSHSLFSIARLKMATKI